ncbi:MAG: hypothetical protein U1E17_05990 [Geminicoccaceae bacterium]
MIAHADGIHANSEAIIAAIEAAGIAIDRAARPSSRTGWRTSRTA